MPKHRVGHRLHVLGRRVPRAGQHRPRLGSQNQVLTRPRPGAPTEIVLDDLRLIRIGIRPDTRRPHQSQRVPNHMVRHGNRSHERLHPLDARLVEHGRDVGLRARGRTPNDLELLGLGRVPNQDLVHEAVELGLGQRIRALLLDGVLRREDEERAGQRVLHATHRHLPLLHRLEQRRLRLGRRAVDLVGQNHIRKHRPAHKPQLAMPRGLVLLDHLRARDIARHQVGGELDPAEIKAERARDRRDQQRLGKPRHADHHRVPPAEDGCEQLLDHVVLPDDHLADLLPEIVVRLAHLGQRRLGIGKLLGTASNRRCIAHRPILPSRSPAVVYAARNRRPQRSA